MPRSPHSSMVGAEVTGKDGLAHEAGAGSEDDSDEDEILEVSENGQWQKINQPVTRDVPGIDAAFLAMDTDDGVEVVWNEVRYSDRKVAKGSKERLVKILQRLTEVKHDNIVNFIDFWHDKVDQQDRLVFITEYMTSGSLMQFLKKAKKTKNSVSEKVWRRWCRQILSALSYLHKNEIVHGNLSLASIFIQHNGLVKIGSVSPDAIHQHVKTKIEETKMLRHYTAPEYAGEAPIQTSADIYAFGICALEMLNLDMLSNGDGHPSPPIKQEAIQRAMEALDKRRKEFIRHCLQEDPQTRLKALALLKHPVLQEVFNLKVLSALALSHRISREKIVAELEEKQHNADDVLAVIPHSDREPRLWKASHFPHLDMDKVFEEIHLEGIYDLRPYSTRSPQKKDDSNTRVAPPSSDASSQRSSSQFYEKEMRRVQRTFCEVKREGEKKQLVLRLQLDDKVDRELRSELKEDDEPLSLGWDLVHSGLINVDDREDITKLMEEKLNDIAALENFQPT